MEHDLNILMIFDRRKMYNFEPYDVLLAIATNIPVLLMTFKKHFISIVHFGHSTNSK